MVKESGLTIEQMQQKAGEVKKAAKALQQKLQAITDPEARKQLAQQMNELFASAKALRTEAKHRHYLEESMEREFLNLQANMEDD
jgi:Fe-S cluster biosynthesis and repair protein YggX